MRPASLPAARRTFQYAFTAGRLAGRIFQHVWPRLVAPRFLGN